MKASTRMLEGRSLSVKKEWGLARKSLSRSRDFGAFHVTIPVHLDHQQRLTRKSTNGGVFLFHVLGSSVKMEARK